MKSGIWEKVEIGREKEFSVYGYDSWRSMAFSGQSQAVASVL
jgi:hypothetical protein